MWLVDENRKLYGQIEGLQNGNERLSRDLTRMGDANEALIHEALAFGRKLEALEASNTWLEKRNLWLNGEVTRLKQAQPNRTAMPDWRTKPPTQKQIAWMESVGMDPTGYNRGQIADLVGFAKKTLATVRERVLDIPEFHDFHPFEQGDGWDGWWNE